MSRPRMRAALNDLAHDVTDVPLAPAAAIRAHGRSRARGRLATVAAVVVAVLGVAVGATFAVQHARPHTPQPASASVGPSVPDGAFRVAITVARDATDADKQVIMARLQSLPVIGDIDFVDRAEAWREFTERFKDAPDLIKTTKPESMPEMFVVIVPDATVVKRLHDQLARQQGVEQIIDQHLPVPSFTPTRR
jgi:cell division protein FtsX